MSNSISGSNLVSWKHLDTSDRGRPLSNTVFLCMQLFYLYSWCLFLDKITQELGKFAFF